MFRFAPKSARITALACAAAVSLSGCEFRETGTPAQAPGDATADGVPAKLAPEPAPIETPEASIIREDATADPAPEAPAEPLELVLPFPDGALLTPRAESLLETALGSDAMAQGWPIVLSGHTDSSGNDQANLRASRSRAEMVAAWLVERGVADSRITVIAFGEQNPIAPNARPDGSANEAGRRLNRRVELRIAPTKNAPENQSSAGRGLDGA